MKDRLSSCINKLIHDPEMLMFCVFTICMSVYYAYRMFAFAPWYDELYTYNFFISRGPVYAGIHWPVPNNHLGYSVLSGLIYVLTHRPYLSLRGISYLCSVGNLIMLFMAGRRLLRGMTGGFSLVLPAVYAGACEVNNITVQGRGYALSVNMMLIALICLINLCLNEKDDLRYYVLWAVSMVIGFYTVMTSLYWVATVCVLALATLLGLRKSARLIRLIIASLAAAAGTVCVYSLVWLAIGSNLMSKDEMGAYFGVYQVDIILHHPILALRTGAEYMLATPYIQSVSRDGYMSAFAGHFLDIFKHFYPFGIFLIVICLLSVVLATVTIIARHRYLRLNARALNDGEELIVFAWMVITFTLVTPAVVWIQCKLPYIRTFIFYAVAVGLCVVFLLFNLFGLLKSYFTYGIGLIVCVAVFAQILGSDYNIPYGDREEAVCSLMKQADLKRYSEAGARICLTDCNQEYMYRFLYDEYPEMCDMQDADIIVVDRDMLDPDAGYHWEFYYDYSTIDADRLAGMKQLIRNTYYEIYADEATVSMLRAE